MFPGLLDCSSDDSEENAEDATDEEETVWFKEHLILVTPQSLIPIQNARCSWDITDRDWSPNEAIWRVKIKESTSNHKEEICLESQYYINKL